MRPESADYVTSFRRRVVLEAVMAAQGATWLRRAQQWEWVRTRPGDYPGEATAAELKARDDKAAAIARAYRAKAEVSTAVDSSSWSDGDLDV